MKKEPSLHLSNSIKRLRISANKLVNSRIVGGYRSVFRGRGMEFSGYRHYSPDDDASIIDWKASVRSKDILVKEFIEERNLNVFFLVDVCSSMVYSSIDKLKMEYAAELVSTLSYTILQSGDSVGFAFFNDKIIKHEFPMSGMKQYHKIVRSLADPSYYGGNYDLGEALKFSMALLKEFSLVIIISDFIGLKEDWKHHLKLVGKKFDLIGIMILDPVDEFLPSYNGQIVVGDPFSDRQLIVNVDSISPYYSKYMQLREEEIRSAFIDANGDFIKLTTNNPFLKPIVDFFIRRAKKIR